MINQEEQKDGEEKNEEEAVFEPEFRPKIPRK